MSDFDGFCRIHESNGFQVVWKGEDGAKLLHNLKDCSPDVILLAWDAPGVGASLVEELAASGTRAPIVIISRPEVHDDLVPVMEAGAAGCLSANLDTPDFLAAPWAGERPTRKSLTNFTCPPTPSRSTSTIS